MAVTTQTLPTHEVAFLQAALTTGFRDVGLAQVASLSSKGQAIARELQGNATSSTDREVLEWAQDIRTTALPARTHNN